MTSLPPFQIDNFESYFNNLKRVGIDPGYVMYTNHHASNDRPAARVISAHQLAAAKAYLENPSDETFIQLVKLGALFDTEWDRRTAHWTIIAFESWEVLHRAFAQLYAKSGRAMEELTGLSGLP